MDARREFIHLLSERLDESGAAKALEAFDLRNRAAAPGSGDEAGTADD